ncbi:putative coiled-coil domain-containing protein 195 [Ctenodactylus gundi]
MEGNRQLLRVIQEMQAEINKLEKENRALRIQLTSSNQKTSGSGQESDEGEEKACEQSSDTLQRGISSDATTPAVQEHQGDVMIVRRYSVSSPAHSFAASDPWKARNKLPNREMLEAKGAVKSLACPSIKKQDNEEKLLAADSCSSNGSSQRASPEDGFGCRDKIKTVSFLLPMDVSSYSKNASSLKYSPNQTTSQLSVIAE